MKKILYALVSGITVFFSSNAILAQTAPDLKTAATYVLFNRNGEFTSNSASSIVIGNVGNEVGAISAFPPGFLSGTKHFQDVAATQAGIDIADAYTDLVSRTCDVNHGVGFGTGETLMPGVYCSTAASTLDGNLTLNGGGNPGAVFIFKINGPLASSSGAQVILTNGATSCNVFWQVNGATALSNTVFRGSILANGAVSLNTGTILDGRAFALAGALIFDTVIASICDAVLLPLYLVDFNVSKTPGNDVMVSWITTSEVNVSRYEVEASLNGTTFYKAGTVSSKGNTYPTRYNFQDVALNKTGTHFYRLKMIDKDGSFTYSEVKSIKFSDIKSLINVFPNPADKILNMTLNSETLENVTLAISNLQGQTLLQKGKVLEKGLNTITEDIHNLSKGTYIVTIKNIKTGEKTLSKFQKL